MYLLHNEYNLFIKKKQKKKQKPQKIILKKK